MASCSDGCGQSADRHESDSIFREEAVAGLVSVVIPAFNHGIFLPETLDSVLAQTYSPIEVILVDDDSTDNTPAVAEAYASKFAEGCFRYLRLSHAGGSRARSEGLCLSRGEYVQFLDSDDLLDPQKIALQVEFLQTHREIDICVAQVQYFVDPDRLATAVKRQPCEYTLEYFVCQGHFITVAALSRRESLGRVGLWDDEVRYGDESEYFGRAIAMGLKAVDQPEALCHYRIHLSNSRRIQRLENMIRTVSLCYERVLAVGRQHGATITPAMDEVMLKFRWLSRVLSGDVKGACDDLNAWLQSLSQQRASAKSPIRFFLQGLRIRLRLVTIRLVGARIWGSMWRLYHRLVGDRSARLPQRVEAEVREVLSRRYGIHE